MVTSKAAVMKEKLTNYIKNEQPPVDRYILLSNRIKFLEVETILRNLFGRLTIFKYNECICAILYLYFCRHVSSSDRVGKRYRNMSSVFSIGDDDEGKLQTLSEARNFPLTTSECLKKYGLTRRVYVLL